MGYQEQEAKSLREQGTPPEEICAMLRISEARLEQLFLGDSVVRIVLARQPDEQLGSMLECLSRADIVVVHRDDEGMCFDILPPSHLLSDRWAERLAGIMTSHGFNAVKAPRWRDA